MKEERYHIALDKYDKNIVLNALNTLRTQQIQEERPTDPVDELISNIAHYAYAPDSGQVTVRTEPDPKTPSVAIVFIDSGRPYNPLVREDPDVTLSAEDREPGGLGIFMVKKTMDDLKYEYRNGQNVLTIRKNL